MASRASCSFDEVPVFAGENERSCWILIVATSCFDEALHRTRGKNLHDSADGWDYTISMRPRHRCRRRRSLCVFFTAAVGRPRLDHSGQKIDMPTRIRSPLNPPRRAVQGLIAAEPDNRPRPNNGPPDGAPLQAAWKIHCCLEAVCVYAGYRSQSNRRSSLAWA
jgi:hypothetical protein